MNDISVEEARLLLETWQSFDIESVVGHELYVAAGDCFYTAVPTLADPTKLAKARAALAVHDHHPREVCPECCEDVCDPCVDALRWALAEVDRLTAELAEARETLVYRERKNDADRAILNREISGLYEQRDTAKTDANEAKDLVLDVTRSLRQEISTLLGDLGAARAELRRHAENVDATSAMSPHLGFSNTRCEPTFRHAEFDFVEPGTADEISLFDGLTHIGRIKWSPAGMRLILYGDALTLVPDTLLRTLGNCPPDATVAEVEDALLSAGFVCTNPVLALAAKVTP